MTTITEKFEGVTLTTRANVYFEGKCFSHAFTLADGTRKSAGVVLPSCLTFGTAAAEIMECVSGSCKVRLKGEADWKVYGPGESFAVPADSSFDIQVEGEPFHYVCHYA